MNKVFRIIWNSTLGRLVVASEAAHSRGKSSGQRLQSAPVVATGSPLLSTRPLALAIGLVGAGVVAPLVSAQDATYDNVTVNNTLTVSSTAILSALQVNGAAAFTGSLTVGGMDVGTAIGDLGGRVDINESDIAGLNTGIDNLGGRVDTNESDIAGLDAGIGNLDGRVDTNESDITGLNTRVGDNESAITDFGTSITTGTVTADSITTGNTSLDTDGLTIGTGGPSVTSSGIDAGELKITGLAEGDIAENSADAVTGGQLYNFFGLEEGIEGVRYFRTNSTKLDSTPEGVDSIAIGPEASTTEHGEGAIALGWGAEAGGEQQGGEGAIAIGRESAALGDSTLALGDGAKITGDIAGGFSAGAMALGVQAHASAGNAIALGAEAEALGSGGIAVGQEAHAAADSALAAGVGAYAGTGRGIALGSGAGVGTESNEAGDRTDHIAIGTESGQRVVGNLTTAIGYRAGQGVTGDDNVALGTEAGGGLEGNNNISIGTKANDGAGGREREQAIAIGDGTASGSDSVALGSEARAEGSETLALGKNASAGENGVALGAHATAEGSHIAIGRNSAARGSDVLGSGYLTGVAAPGSAVSVGNSNPDAGESFQRRIVNVADGAQRYDAVNVGQLKGAQQSVATLVGGGVTLGADGNYGVITLEDTSGVSHEFSTVADAFNALSTGAIDVTSIPASVAQYNGDGQITGVTAGTNATDAVNVQQLNDTVDENGIKYYSANTTLEANRLNDGATGDNAMAIGPAAVAGGTSSLAAGHAARVNHGADNGVAIGHNVSARAENATVLGNRSHTYDAGGVAIGQQAVSRGLNSIVMGTGAEADPKSVGTVDNAIVIGTGAEATADDGIAVGRSALASEDRAVAQGFDAHAMADDAMAFGSSSRASGVSSQASGTSANASGVNAQARGTRAEASGLSAIASGTDAEGMAAHGIAMGTGAVSGFVAQTTEEIARNRGSIAIGERSLANERDALALGVEASAEAESATAIGDNAEATEDAEDGLAVGSSASVTAQNAAAFGQSAAATDIDALAVGSGAVASAARASAFGQSAAATDIDALAVGAGAEASQARASAFGQGAEALAIDALAAGSGARATEQSASAIGRGAQATAQTASAFGQGANASGVGALATGSEAQAIAQNATALGQGASALHQGSVALGSGSETANVVPTPNAEIDGNTYTYAGAGAGVTSTVSVGAPDQERTLTNVAAGRVNEDSTDAINGSQLYGTNQSVEALAGNLDTAGESVADALGGTSAYDPVTHTVTTGLSVQGNNYSNVQDALTYVGQGWDVSAQGGTAENVAPGGSVDFSSNDGNITIARSGTDLTFGLEGEIEVADSIRVGGAGGTFIDGDSVTTGDLAAGGSTLVVDSGAGTVTYNGNQVATQADGLRFDGNTGNTITRSLSDTGALTISGELAGSEASTGANLRVDGDSDANQLNLLMARDLTDLDSITINSGGPVIDSSGIDMGGNKVTNLAAGTDPTDAVTFQQLSDTAFAAGSWSLTDADGGTASIGPDGSVNFLGDENVSVAQSGAEDEGQIDITLNPDLMVDSVTTGNTLVNNDGLTVDDGAGNLTTVTHDGLTIADGPSITASGIDAGDLKITNVADGDVNSTSTDAINGSQLFGSVDSINSVIGGNAVVDTDGAITTTDIGNTGQDTVHDAIDSVNTAANAGWNLSGSDANEVNIGPNGDVDFQGDDNISVAQSGLEDDGQIDITLNPDLVVDSVTTGNTLVNNDGLTVDDGGGNVTDVTATGTSVTDGTNSTDYGAGGMSITDGPSVTSGGIDGGDNQITGVDSGLDGTPLAEATDDTLTNAANIGDLQTATGGLTSAGLNFEGNTGGEIHKDLGDTLNIVGSLDDDADASDANLRVDNVGGELRINLATNLTDLEDIQVGRDGVDGVDGVDGLIGVNGEDGASVVLDGADGSIGLTGPRGADGEPGPSTNIRVADGAPGLDGEDGTTTTRIVYTDDEGGEQEVANLNDGLHFVGDDGQVVSRKLNETLGLTGGADLAELSENNIGVVQDGDGLSIQLAENVDLGDEGSVTTGDTVMDNGGLQVGDATGNDPSTTVGAGRIDVVGSGTDPNTIAIDGDVGTIGGLENQTIEYPEFADGSGRAASEEQLSEVGGALGDLTDTPLTFAGDAGPNVERQLGETVNLVGGETDEAALTEGNIGVVADGDETLQIQLAENIDLGEDGSVTTGNSVLDDSGLAIDDGAGNLTTVTNDGLVIANGPSITASGGIDANDQVITSVGAGEISDTSSDAINGSQLFGSVDSINNVVGGNAVVNPDGTITTTDIGNTGQDTVHDAIDSVNTAANAGWNLSGSDANEVNIGPNGAVDFQGDDNISVAQSGAEDDGQIDITLDRDLDVDSVTAGDAELDTDGLAVTDTNGNQATTSATGTTVTDAAGNVTEVTAAGTSVTDGASSTDYGAEGVIIADGPRFTNDGISAGDQQITNVEAGVADTDAVNVSQLNSLADTPLTFAGDAGPNVERQLGETVNLVGGETDEAALTEGNIGVVADGDETLQIQLAENIDLGEDGSVTTGNSVLDDSGLAIDDGAGNTTTTTVAGTTVIDSSGNETTLSATGTTVTDAAGNETVVSADGVAVGDDVTLGNSGLVIGDADGPRFTNNGISAGDQQITNVEAGVADTDAVNVSQLNSLADTPLTFAGDAGPNVERQLGETVNLVGGETDEAALTEGNIGVVADGDETLQIQLAENIDLGEDGSVTTGNSVLDDSGLAIDDGAGNTTTTTVAGTTVIDSSGNETTLSATGTTVTDAAGNETVVSADGVAVGDDVTLGNSGLVIGDADGPRFTNNGISAGNQVITNVADGDISETSTDAINGSQLYGVQQVANAGWNLTGSGENSVNIGPNGAVDFRGDNNITVSQVDDDEYDGVIEVALSDTITLGENENAITVDGTDGSITTGDTIMDGDGVRVGEDVALDTTGLVIADGPSVTINGIDAGGMQITNVGSGLGGQPLDQIEGADLMNAVNVGDLQGVASDMAAARTVVEAEGENITVDSSTDGNGQTTYTVEIASDVDFDSIQADSIEVGTVNIDQSNVDENSNTIITGVGRGEISADSTDAVNGSQLYDVAQELGDIDTVLDGGMNFGADEGEEVNRKLGDTVAVTGDDNITTRTISNDDGVGVEVTLNRELAVDSVTTGRTTVSDQGVSIEGGPSMTVDGIDGGGQRITNVAPGVDATDAVNIGQMQELNQRFANEINNVHGRINDVEKDANAGTASALAASTVPQAWMPGKSMVGVGAGTYEGESAVSVGISRMSDNGRWIIQGKVTGDSQSNFGAGVGAGWHW